MQNIQPNIQNLRQIISEYHWLDLAESVSIAASAIGTLAGALSGQVVYAAAPLTVALSLNLANRYRLDENTEQYTKAAISDVRNVVESLYTALPENDQPQMDFQALQKSIYHLQKVTERLENKALTEDDWQMVNVRFLTLQESLEKLTQSIGNSPLVVPAIQIGEAGENPGENYGENPGEGALAPYSELEQRISQLEQKNHEVIKPYLQRLTQTLQQLKQDQSLGKVRKKIQALSEEIKQRTVVQVEVETLTQQLETIAAQQAQLNQQFLELPAPPVPVDISNVESAIAQISEDLTTTKTQTSKRFKRILSTLNALEGQINQLQQLSHNLQSSVENVTEDLDSLTDAANVENLENILNQVSAELAEVQHKINSLTPTFNPAPLEQQLQELSALIKQQPPEPTQFLTKEDIAPLVAAIKKLQKKAVKT
jgi:tetrahydromethanopterin S-methyltransferase subunit B/lipoate-protein ligase A